MNDKLEYFSEKTTNTYTLLVTSCLIIKVSKCVCVCVHHYLSPSLSLSILASLV